MKFRYAIVVIILILVITTILIKDDFKNSGLTTNELIKYFENNGYSLKYYEFNNTYNNITKQYKSFTLENNNIRIYYSIDDILHSISFKDTSLNDESYYIKFDTYNLKTTNDLPKETKKEKNHQKKAYKKWLRTNGISSKQLLILLEYCFQKQYKTK